MVECVILEEPVRALTVYTFRVTDASTGLPVAGAQCVLSDDPNLIVPFEGDGCISGADGVCSIDVVYFNPRYYSVYKAGYETVRGVTPGTTIDVVLGSTEVLYNVAVHAGPNGRVDPSGNFQVEPSTKLTVKATPDVGYVLKEWLVNGVSSGNTNPIGVFIDRDSFSIAAVFKVADTPPPDGEPPSPPGWAVEKEIHVFDSERVKSEMWDISKSITRFLRNVDIRLLEGGRLDYSITYLQGNSLPIPRVKVFFNEDVYVESPIRLRETKTGSIDLTGLILRTNSITLEVESTILLWAECAFDIWVTLGFSEDPIIDPGGDPGWEGWWPWAIAGGVATVALVGGTVMYQEMKHREEMLALMVRG